jgi:hypothetical protein
MSLYKQFRTDPKAEKDGVVLDYGEGGRIRIARAGGSNKAYLSAIEKMHRKYRKQIQLNILSEDVSQRILREIFADTVILGWEGVTGPDGKDLDFTRANVLKVLEDLPDLFADIREQASSAALFRETLEEIDSGN